MRGRATIKGTLLPPCTNFTFRLHFHFLGFTFTLKEDLEQLFVQGIYLFSVMSESTALQKLSLDGNDLSMVPPEHVAKGTNRLQEVKL